MATEIEPTTELTETPVDKPYLAEESRAFSNKPPKRARGGQRKDGAPPGTAPPAKDVPTPRYTSFYSDHDNPHQKTRAAWTWWKGLKPAQWELLDAHVYRSWPVLLDPIDESEHKYIDKIIGSQPIQNDQDFVDRYGAGDFVLYLNVNPVGDNRRTIFIAYIKCTHDFRTYPPTDRRVDNVDNISLTDPANAAYVAWLRANGKLKDEAKESKEKEEMSAATAGLTDVLGKALDRGDRLMEKLIEERTTEPPISIDPPPSAEEKLNESLTLLERISSFNKTTTDPLQMMSAVIEAAKTLNQSSSPQALTPFMDRISALEKEVREKEAQMLNSKLSEITEQLKALKEAPPPSNVLLPDGSNLDAIVKKAVEKAVESGLGGEADNSWWIEPAKQLLPVALPLLGSVLQRFMMPPPPQPAAPFPMPPGAVMQPQAQLPAPQPQQQPMPQAQPQQAGGAYTTGNPQLDMLLMMIQVPLADHLRDDATGGEFAEYFIDTYGLDIHTQLASSGVEPIVAILYSYPPLGPILKPLAREKVVKFITDFAAYKPSAQPPAGNAA